MKTIGRQNRIKRGSLVLAIVAMLAIGTFLAAKRVAIGQLAHAQVLTTPFIAEIHVYDFQKNADGEWFYTRVVARRSDGTTALVESFGPRNWGQSIRKVTFMDGRSVMLSDLIGSRTTMRKMNEEIARLKKLLTAPPPDCRVSRQTVIGYDRLSSQPVVILELDEDTHKLKTWNAPGLGCESSQWESQIKQADGSLKLGVQAKLARLLIGEPDPAFFDPKSQYVETKPSDVERQIVDKLGAPHDPKHQKNFEKLDQEYLKRQ